MALAPARQAPENAQASRRLDAEQGQPSPTIRRSAPQAEAQFKQVQKAQPAARPTTEGGQATADYVAAGHAVRAKTAQLKELRLAKEVTDKIAKAKHVTKRASRGRR